MKRILLSVMVVLSLFVSCVSAGISVSHSCESCNADEPISFYFEVTNNLESEMIVNGAFVVEKESLEILAEDSFTVLINGTKSVNFSITGVIVKPESGVYEYYPCINITTDEEKIICGTIGTKLFFSEQICKEDSFCSADEFCTNGGCVKLECLSNQAIVSHKCLELVCGSDEVAQGNKCVAQTRQNYSIVLLIAAFVIIAVVAAYVLLKGSKPKRHRKIISVSKKRKKSKR